MPDLPEGRHHAAAVSVGDKLYVIGGYSGVRFIPRAEVFEFDPLTKTWTQKSPLNEPRGALAAAVIDGKIYAVGGVEPGGLSSRLEVYDPTTDK